MLSKFSGSRQDLQFVLLLGILLGVLGISLFLAVSMGSVAIHLGDTYRIILSRLGFPLEVGEVSKSTLAIVWNMRFPRVLLGLIVGAGLSMCGSVMQSTVNNPIAEPYVLGISAGATLGATLSIILGLKVMISLGAFLGAILATIAVLIIASMQGRMTTSSLILSGTVVNALFLAFSNFIISVGANADNVMTIKFWTMGSLAGTSWADLVLPTIVVGMAFLFFSTQYRVFNAMMMGDEAALTLGIPLRFLLVSLCDHGGCSDSSLSSNLWDYWICWSDYSSLSSRVSRNELQETFSCCDHTGCPFCYLGRCTFSCHYSKC